MIDRKNSGELEVFVVWIPMQRADSLDAARKAMAIFEGTQVRQFWDGDRALGRLIAGSVPIDPVATAWDIYLRYDRGAVMGERAPAPADWIHQLGEADPARYRGGRIEEAVAGLGE